MKYFSCLSPEETVLLASTVAIFLSKELDIDETAALGAFLTTVGDNLALIATQKDINDSHCKC